MTVRFDLELGIHLACNSIVVLLSSFSVFPGHFSALKEIDGALSAGRCLSQQPS